MDVGCNVDMVKVLIREAANPKNSVAKMVNVLSRVRLCHESHGCEGLITENCLRVFTHGKVCPVLAEERLEKERGKLGIKIKASEGKKRSKKS